MLMRLLSDGNWHDFVRHQERAWSARKKEDKKALCKKLWRLNQGTFKQTKQQNARNNKEHTAHAPLMEKRAFFFVGADDKHSDVKLESAMAVARNIVLACK